MMVKATPTSTFVMAQAEFTFELFVITFDAPAQFGIIDECGEGRVLGQGRKPVFCGSRLSLRPFDEQPFDRMRCGSLGRSAIHSYADFKGKVKSSMHSLQRNTKKIRSFFAKDTLRYAA